MLNAHREMPKCQLWKVPPGQGRTLEELVTNARRQLQRAAKQPLPECMLKSKMVVKGTEWVMNCQVGRQPGQKETQNTENRAPRAP